MTLGATTIALIYKDRWQIELFFKALKQNLKIKTFVGTSANAVKIQIWTALIAMLILRFFQFRSKFNWSLSNLVALLRMNLFTHRDLRAWLNSPLDVLPVPYEPEQLRLNFA
jgi:IS4 transposase